MESEPGLPPDEGSEAVPSIPPCPACGVELREGANFCPACGEPLREGLARAPRRLSARQILYDVRATTTPVRKTLTFYLLWVAAGVISGIAAYAGAITVHIMMAIDTLTTSLTFGWAAAFRREVFRLYAVPRRAGVWLGIPVLAAWPIAAAVSLFVGWLNGLIGFEFSYTKLFLDHGFGWTWIILMICLQPALVEELAFRGVLQTTLGDAMKPGEAIAVSAIAFAIMHFNLAVFVPFTLFGMYLGWLRHRSLSLWPGMLAHFVHNLLIMLDEHVNVLPG